MNFYKKIAIIDAAGVYGSLLHYAVIIFFVGSAFLIFIHLWRKGKLDMDEEPKMQMMQDSEKTSKGEGDNEQ